jgi:hypothetical protein
MTLFKKTISDHMTAAPHDRTARMSYPGQAHFGGTGPALKTCRECRHWGDGKPDYHSRTGKYHGLIRPAPCAKFRALMHEIGGKVPDDAPSCRYFEQADVVPKRFAHLMWSP